MGQHMEPAFPPRPQLAVQPNEAVTILHRGHCSFLREMIPKKSPEGDKTQSSVYLGQYYCPCQYYSPNQGRKAVCRIVADAERWPVVGLAERPLPVAPSLTTLSLSSKRCPIDCRCPLESH